MHRFIQFFFFVTGIALLIDIYAFQAVKSAVQDFSVNGKRATYFIYWAFSVFTFSTFIIAFVYPFETWPAGVRMYVFSTILIVFLAKFFILPWLVLEDFVRIIKWVAGLFAQYPAGESGGGISRSKFLGQFAMIAGGVPLALGLHGMLRNAYNYKVHRVKVQLPHLPEAFDGLKIVQISDIHSGSFVSRAQVEKGVELINSLEADLVLFTGDLVNYKANEMFEFIDVFKKIKAKEGVYSIFGNHDYADYIRWSPGQEEEGRRQNRETMIGIHKSLGWNLMLNENRRLQRGSDSIALIGCENWSSKGFRVYGDMSKAYAGCESSPVKLLLSHDPSHWEGEIQKKYPDIDIMFSGHTHGAQCGVEIPGFFRWSPSQYIYKQWAGLYQQGKQYLYVNRGFGFIGYHGRIGILPEVTFMELHKG